MKTPAFWYQSSSFLSLCLWPFSFLYQSIHKLRFLFTSSSRVNVPVICVGNIVMGGAGKTPAVIEIAQFLQKKGQTPHILSRGYKGHLTGRVDPLVHSFKDVGDEALLLARIAPTWVGKDRISNAFQAIQNGATHLVLDDGFQNPSLFKDLSIIIENKRQERGNGRIFPAGPLRESIESALKRADFVWTPEEKMIGPKSNVPLIAFAGIGYPEKFFHALKNNGFSVIKTFSYPDHYAYAEKDLLFLRTQALAHKAILATTAKDAVRLNQPDLLIFDVKVSLPPSIAHALCAF